MMSVILMLVFILAVPLGLSQKKEIEWSRVTLSATKTEKVSLRPALKRICSCESTGSPNNTPRQFNADGSVVRGKINPHDVGMCQVNEDYHLAAAKKLGMDIYTEEGNIRYANHLYDTQGARPWGWSNSCHHALD